MLKKIVKYAAIAAVVTFAAMPAQAGGIIDLPDKTCTYDFSLTSGELASAQSLLATTTVQCLSTPPCPNIPTSPQDPTEAFINSFLVSPLQMEPGTLTLLPACTYKVNITPIIVPTPITINGNNMDFKCVSKGCANSGTIIGTIQIWVAGGYRTVAQCSCGEIHGY